VSAAVGRLAGRASGLGLLLAAGEADATLTRLVDFLITWADSPPVVEPPPPGGHEVLPSG
jgi:hypothetical protein